MTHRNVETLIGRLATDPVLRRRFAVDSVAVLGELREEGYELTGVELEVVVPLPRAPVLPEPQQTTCPSARSGRSSPTGCRF